MDSRSVKTAADARALVEARGLSHVKIGVVDLDGVIRGKYLARDKFFNALEAGFNFCDVIFGWDSQDQLYDKSTFTGWHTAFPDAAARIDPTSCRDVPMEGDMLFFLGEFEGTAAELCPRRLLRLRAHADTRHDGHALDHGGHCMLCPARPRRRGPVGRPTRRGAVVR